LSEKRAEASRFLIVMIGRRWSFMKEKLRLEKEGKMMISWV